MIMKKIQIFLLTVAFGALVTSQQVLSNGFTEATIRGWILDSLFVAALVGFVVVKYLKMNKKL